MLRLPLALLGLLLASCACPPLVESFASPQETLACWQAHLCRDDAQGEYACLAASFQRAMGGFENYHAARAALLDQQPVTAWLLGRADLADYVTASSFASDGRSAALQLQARGETLLIRFEREAFVTLAFADGSTVTARQSQPMDALLASEAGRTHVLLDKPPLAVDQYPAVRSIHLDSRWRIADLAGLAELGAPRTGAAP